MEKANLKVIDSKNERMMIYKVNGVRMTAKGFDEVAETVKEMKGGLPHIETIGDDISAIVSDAIGEAFKISSIGNVIARQLDEDAKRIGGKVISDMIDLCGVITDATEKLKDYLQAIDDLREEEQGPMV